MIGIIGCGGRGVQLGKTFQSFRDVDMQYVCDPDEQRIWSPYREDENGNSTIIYGTNGMMKLGRPGIPVFGAKNKLLKREKRDGHHGAHQRNFVDAFREGKSLNAHIEIGHLPSALCHLGSIVARVGRAVRFNPQSEQVLQDNDANSLIQREYRDAHWASLESNTA